MTKNRILYLLLVILLAGAAALSGAAAGGVAMYQYMSRAQTAKLAALTPVTELVTVSNNSQGQGTTLIVDSTKIETTVIQAVQKVGPAVVTVSGTVTGQLTPFGKTSGGTVSGSGVFISDQGYILTNNHVVEGTQGDLTITLADGSQEKAKIVGTDQFSDIAVLKTDGKVPAVAALGNSDVLTSGRDGHRHRLAAGRFQEHRHRGRGQRHGTVHRYRQRLHHRQPDPDRCRHQPG